MFDIGFFEILFIGIIMLLILGPEKMPHAVRMTGAWLGKIRRSFMDAKYEIERQIKLEEFKSRVAEQKKEIEATLLNTEELNTEELNTEELNTEELNTEELETKENHEFEPLSQNTDSETDPPNSLQKMQPKNEI